MKVTKKKKSKPKYRPKLEHKRERPVIELPDGCRIIQDTREQLELFKPCHYIIDKALRVGDYSIYGMERLVTIERKSIGDLFGSLGTGRENFEKRIVKMKDMIWAGLLIEGCEGEVMREQEWSSMVVNQIYHAISSYEVKSGIHIYFAENRDCARDWVLSRLGKFYKSVRDGSVKIT